MNKATPILQVQNLSVGFTSATGLVQAVTHGVSFEIHRGEVFALVGESGSGKSVTAMALTKLLPRPGAHLLSGQVWLNQVDLLAISEQELQTVRGKKIAYVFQEPALAMNPVRTIGSQMRESLQSQQGADSLITELMAQVGFSESQRILNSYPHELSGGQLQRVMIAMALLFNPSVFVADEPTTALDVTVQAQVMQLLRDLCHQRGIALLLITHNLALVAQYADRLAVMQHGTIVEENKVVNLLKSPQHPYTQALLKAVPDGQKPYASHVAQDVQKPILEVQNMSVWYPVRGGLFSRVTTWVKALRNTDLHIARGEILAIVGESGCGKSTLASALVGIHPWQTGSMELQGQKIDWNQAEHVNHVRSTVQMVFQDPYGSLNPRQSVEEILTWPLRARGISYATALERACTALDQVGLERASLNRFPHAFSGGQRQRIGIARALALQSKILICDEPTSALDVSVQQQILELISNLRKELSLSILFISHDLAVVQALSDRVMVMYLGTVVETATTKQLFNAPQHPYTQALLQSVPTLQLEKKPKVLVGDLPSLTQIPEGCVFAMRCPKVTSECRKGAIDLVHGVRCIHSDSSICSSSVLSPPSEILAESQLK